MERGRWRAEIFEQGKAKHLGTFDTEVAAARAYIHKSLLKKRMEQMNLLRGCVSRP